MAQITKNNSDTFGQIQDMLKAYYPILYLTTFEYDRTKQKLRGVAKNLNKNFQFYEWNCVDGLGKRDLNEGGLTPFENVEEPEELLKHISNQTEKDDNEIYVLELKKELFELRFRHATGQLETVVQLKEVKKTIARIKTGITEKELQE